MTDADRLAALASFEILDTPPEPGFDGIVQLATRLCDAPVALVSLVAADRQWFKARIGFPRCETDLNSSICAHALSESDLLVIPDLADDARTMANPLVTGDPFLRFYAGAPLRSWDGQVLGTLCVIDHKPRPGGLDSKQADDLRLLAEQVVSQLELRRAVASRDALLARQAANDRERLTFLETSHAIGMAGGQLDVILGHLVRGTMAAVPAADAGVMEMLDGEDLVYCAACGTAQHAEGLRVPLGASIAGLCARTGQPLSIPDMREDARAEGRLVARLGIRSALLAPVMRAGQVLGVLKLHASRPGVFTARDLEVVKLFAAAASTGLAEAREVSAQRAATVSETRYQAVFDSAIDYAMVVMDRQGLVTDWNVGAERILGWSAADMRGRPAELFFTPEDRAAGVPAREMASALATGRGTDERWHLCKSGERFWANGEMMALRDESGAVIGFLKIMRDRTEQHATFEKLQASEQQLSLERSLLQSIVQQIPVGISIAYADGHATLNERARRMLGQEPGSGGERYAGYHAEHPDGRRYDSMEYPTMRALMHGERVDAEVMLYRHAGLDLVRRWEVTSSPVRGPDGRIDAAVSVFVDVEDQLQASEALAASEERLKLSLSASGVIGWFDWHVQEDRIYGGERFARAFGLEPARAAAGAPLAEYLEGIHPEDRAQVSELIAAALDEGGAYDAEYRLLDASGGITWVQALGRVIMAPTGRPLRFSGLVSDITVRKLASLRQAAIIELGDRLRDLGTVADITREAAGVVGRTLGVVRAGFGRLDTAKTHVDIEPDWTAPGIASIAGRHRLSDYGHLRHELLRSKPLVVDDVRSDIRTAEDPSALLALGVHAFVNMPVRERGQTVAVFMAHDDRPRQWTLDELSFLRTVADRVEVGVARLAAEHQQSLLNHELSHRLKNTLAMVQAIVSQTLRNTADLGEAKTALIERLAALSKTHELLMTGTAVRASMEAVIRGAIRIHDDPQAERFVIGGPAIEISARAALSLALMMHEMATNAAKYGALSNVAGHVEVHWRIGGAPELASLSLVWEEKGGPTVVPPTHVGFGSKLIQRGLAGAVGGTVEIVYQPTGLVCQLVAPLSGFTAEN